MSTTALTADGRFPVRRRRPNRPSVDNTLLSSWCPHFGVRFTIAHCLTPCCTILSEEALNKFLTNRRGKFVNERRLGSSTGIPITIRWLAGLANRQMASVHLKRLSEMGLLKEIVAGCEKLFVNLAFLELLAQ